VVEEEKEKYYKMLDKKVWAVDEQSLNFGIYF
jgi:hypothetical protein